VSRFYPWIFRFELAIVVENTLRRPFEIVELPAVDRPHEQPTDQEDKDEG